MHPRSERGATRPTIVYVSHASEWGGGGEMVLLQLLGSARRLGYSTCLVCPPGDLAVHAESESDRLVLTPVPWPRRTTSIAGMYRLLTTSIRFWRTLTRVLMTSRARVIHANSGAAALVCALPAILTGVPLIWHQHDIIPSRRVNTMIFRILGRTCTRTVATSGAVHDSLLRLGVPSHRVVVIYPALRARFHVPALSRQDARRALGVPGDSFIVAVVGRLVQRKAQDMLLLALETVRGHGIAADALIIGSPPSASIADGTADAYLASLQALAGRPGSRGHVYMHEFRDDIETVMDAADCLAVPSYCEPFGMVIPEAFARSLPVVATTCGGPLEIVEPDKSGLLVPPGDPEALARSIECLAIDPVKRKELGAYARSVAVNRFSEAALSAQLAHLYADSAPAQVRFGTEFVATVEGETQ